MTRSNGTCLPTPLLIAIVAGIAWAVWYVFEIGGHYRPLAADVAASGTTILFIASAYGEVLPRWLRTAAIAMALIAIVVHVLAALA